MIQRIQSILYIVSNCKSNVHGCIMIIKNKFLINVDSKSELEKIAAILKGKPAEVSLRISLKDSKFGFDEAQLNSIIEYAKSGNIFIT